jgi:hypothetical protein
MRTSLLWADALPPTEAGTPSIVWDIAFRPDGSLMVVASGRWLVVYNCADGVKVKTRQGE